MTDLDNPPVFDEPHRPSGHVELIFNEDHYQTVVIQGMLKARSSVAIMTADLKAMLIPGPGRKAVSLIRQLRVTAQNGIEIRMLHAGVPSGPALQELKGELPSALTIRRCPRLHSKIVIIDCEKMYMGSANITGAGMGAKAAHRRNFEAGVWTQDASLIDASMEHFNTLWEGEQCTACGRRDICPVPLEEPKLS